jgi:Phage-related minor tail protein
MVSAMADSIIGALRVVLGADTGSFEDGLKRSENQLNAFEATITKWAKRIVTALTLKEVAQSITETIDHIEKLADTSEKIGVPVEELSALQHAANLANVSFDTLESSMGRLSKNMVAAASGAINPAAEAFGALKINVENADGSLKTNSEVLGDIADKFAGFEDGVQKTALAIAIFGRAGADMIPILNQGRAGIAAATAEAKLFGIVVDKETAEAAKRFNDNLDRVNASIRGVFIQGIKEATPALDALGATLVKVASNGDLTGIAVEAISKIIFEFALAALQAVHNSEQLVRIWTLLRDIGKAQFGDIDAVTAAWQKYKQATADALVLLDANILSLKGLGDEVDALIKAYSDLGFAQEEAANKPAAPALKPIKDAKDAVDQFIESTGKSITAINAEIAAFGLSAGSRERLRITMQAEELQRAKNITLTKEQIAEIERLGNEAEVARNKLSTMNKIEDALPAWEKYQKEIEKTREEFKSAGKDLEDFQEVNKRIAEKFGMTWEQGAAGIFSSFGAVTKEMGNFSSDLRKMVAISQALMAASALISSYAASAQALATGFFPFNMIAAATVLAHGLALAAAIRSIGFAKGGSFRVGGGMTGVDSEMVAFRATPGEMVDVRRPGQPGGGHAQVIQLQMPRTDNFFSLHVREMVMALNKAAPDGYVLKVSR